MNEYDPKQIEPKWQQIWEKLEPWKAEDNSKKPKYYALVEFPYPSGDGLHTGHVRSYTALDIVSRKKRREGHNVLYPIGWDAFGLPAENYAIKTGIHPSITTAKNIETYRRQLKNLGIWFDWSREVNTTDPAYYKWTQWLFLQFQKEGLAYKAKSLVNWCPKDKTVLANEEVIDGKCDRCGTVVEKREKEQWMLAITKYAERLDQDLDTVDYPERVKAQQRNWIGKSEGAEINFPLVGQEGAIKVFTTRPDTIFGATFLALSPRLAKSMFGKDFDVKEDTERENKEKIGVDSGHKARNPASGEEIPVWVVNYVSADYGTGAIMAVPAHDERDFEFATKYNLPIREVIIPKVIDEHDPPIEGKKTVERRSIQAIIIDPKTGKVLMLRWKKFPWTTFITGGVEGEEDLVEAAKREIFEETGYKNVKYIRTLGGLVESHYFANHKDENRKAVFSGLLFELENEERQEPSDEEKAIHEAFWMTWDEIGKDKNTKCAEYDIWLDRLNNEPHAFPDHGVLTNSGKFDNKNSEEAKKEIVESIGGKIVTKFKLRDWVFSRQRYWGEPIPMIHCDKCGWQPVPEKDLPVRLPEVEKYEPTDTGESPLANIPEWVNTTCPKCEGPAKRETDTMPQWAGSSWYFLRYTDPRNDKEFASKGALKEWTPVDWYNGGMEHTTLHLLYSRFWNKFFFDQGLVPTSEPYQKRTSHGLILAEGGEKMSKSKGNVVNPDKIVEMFGADTLRLYEMFMGTFEQAIAWNESSLVGPRRFIERVWKLHNKISQGKPSDTDSQGLSLMNQTVKKVSEDIETLGFNTAVSALMIWTNSLEKSPSISREEYETLLKLLAPFAPHVTEELWSMLGHQDSIHSAPWPAFDPQKLAQSDVTLAVQVNGKVRATLTVASTLGREDIEKMALSLPEIGKWLSSGQVSKVVVVPGRIVNIVLLSNLGSSVDK